MKSDDLLACAQRLQSLAQAGIEYATNGYDMERFEEVRAISVRLLQELTDEPVEKIVRLFASDSGYQTPKIDIRAVLFRHAAEILLVQEKIDHLRWTLPGGWADVGYSPFENAVKEVEEETGLKTRATRLLALLDKRMHAHPHQANHAYKIFIECEVIGGELQQDTGETAGARWFRRDELAALDLSTDRVTLSQLYALFAFASGDHLAPLCD